MLRPPSIVCIVQTAVRSAQCIFEPRVIEFEHKLVYMRTMWDSEVGEEIVEQVGDQIVSVSALVLVIPSHLLTCVSNQRLRP
jgi:hypothetical protein